MVRAALIGASGYTGIELLRLLAGHPHVEVTCLVGDASAGQNIIDVYPHLTGFYNHPIEGFDAKRVAEQADVVFAALPSGHVGEYISRLLEYDLRIIDLGGDLRLPAHLYQQWYGKPPVPPTLQRQAVYGLAEWYAAEIRESRVVANPGCYPTASLLALLPLLNAQAIHPDSIIIDAKSGVSGAGRGPTTTSLFAEINENFKTYKPNTHQHTPEIEGQLARVARQPIEITFTPHLVPMNRGIFVTVYAQATKGWDEEVFYQLYQTQYADKAFVRIRGKGNYPQTKEVAGTNFCDIGFSLDTRTGRLTVFSVIDNLVKGASGQAIQNLNLVFDLEETAGLLAVPMYP